jgi:hypothetical protein
VPQVLDVTHLNPDLASVREDVIGRRRPFRRVVQRRQELPDGISGLIDEIGGAKRSTTQSIGFIAHSTA